VSGNEETAGGAAGRAARRGDRIAAHAAWQTWLDGPDEARLEAMARWQPPPGAADYAFTAVTEKRATSGDRRLIGALCTRLGVMPGDPVRRALFYVLTGQREQHRALDPDGALLAGGYQTLGWEAKGALREMLAGSGDLDLVRVLARPDGSGGRARLGWSEAEFVLAELAGRRDRHGMWRALQHLPLDEAVAAIRRFRGRWRPADGPDRMLFDLLKQARPAAVRDARSILTWLPPAVRCHEGPDEIERCSFSPDGQHLAVSMHGPVPANYGYGQGRVWVTWYLFETRSGMAIATTVGGDPADPSAAEVVTAGGNLFGLGAPAGKGIRAALKNKDNYWKYPQVVMHAAYRPADIVPYPDGFVFLHLPPGGTGSLDPRLVFCDSAGQVTHEVRLADDLGVPASHQAGQRLAAADPGTGRLLLAGERLRMLDARARRVLGTSPRLEVDWRAAGPGQAAFTDPDRVVTADPAGGLRLWRRSGSRLEAEASAPATRLVTAFPDRGEIAAVGGEPDAGRAQRAVLRSLAPANAPLVFTRRVRRGRLAGRRQGPRRPDARRVRPGRSRDGDRGAAVSGAAGSPPVPRSAEGVPRGQVRNRGRPRRRIPGRRGRDRAVVRVNGAGLIAG
jgi:hypothetical protein